MRRYSEDRYGLPCHSVAEHIHPGRAAEAAVSRTLFEAEDSPPRRSSRTSLETYVPN